MRLFFHDIKTQVMKNVFIVLSFFLMIGCKKEEIPNNGNNNNIFQPTAISFVEIGKGALYGNGAEEISQSNLVITDSVVWQSLLTQMDSVNNVSDSFSEINVDFSNYMI